MKLGILRIARKLDDFSQSIREWVNHPLSEKFVPSLVRVGMVIKAKILWKVSGRLRDLEL